MRLSMETELLQYNMMGMGQIGPDGQILGPPDGGPMMPQDPSLVPKDLINFKSFTLFPPTPNAPPPTTRERPPGCKTIFVGGLPENATGRVPFCDFKLFYLSSRQC